MNKVYVIVLFFTSVFLAGCFDSSQPHPRPDRIDNRTDEYYEERRIDNRTGEYYKERRSNDEDRDDVIRNSRRRYSGNTCEDEGKNHDCVDQCRDIYSRRSDKDDCEELSVAQIERLVEIHELLEDPDEDDLPSIDPEDFDVYLNISIEPLDKFVGKYSTNEAKEFMVWLIDDENAFNIFQKEDDEYETLQGLLGGISSGDVRNDNIYKPFIAKIESGYRLMEFAVDSGDEDVIEWFMDYIFEKNSNCERDEITTACFTLYCKIGKEMDRDYRDDWLRFDNFQEYIDEIISDGINNDGGSNSGTYYWGSASNKYEDTGDIDDWYDDLCSGL